VNRTWSINAARFEVSRAVINRKAPIRRKHIPLSIPGATKRSLSVGANYQTVRVDIGVAWSRLGQNSLGCLFGGGDLELLALSSGRR
jgi:hypothetical protein